MVRKYLQKGREKAVYHTRRSFSYAKGSAAKFQREFRKHLITAISAALGFLIALSWREPLSELVDLIIASSGLQGEALFYKFFLGIFNHSYSRSRPNNSHKMGSKRRKKVR